MSSALDRLRALDEEQRKAAAPPPPPRSKAGGVIGVGMLALLALKLVGKLKLLAGVAKLGKFATTAWTMVAMAWAYSFFFGWPFAAGLVLLILVHELGHGAAAARVGLPVGAPVFIPFFGAFIALKEQPRSTFDDAVIGAGGPIFGTAGALVCLGLAWALPDAAVLLAVGYFALVINLFNLMPVWGLDGSRMLSPVSPRVGAVGVVVLGVTLGVLTWRTDHANPIALIVVAVAGWQVAMRFWRARRELPRSTLGRLEATLAAARQVPDDGVTPAQRRAAAATYFLLALGLICLVTLLHGALPAIGG